MRESILLTLGVVLGALLTILAFPPFGLDLLVFVAPVPWLLVALRAEPRTGFVYGYLGSLVVYLFGLRWMSVVSWPGLIASSVILSFYGGFLFSIIGWIARRTRWPVAWVAPFVWVVLDGFRSFVLTGFAWLYLGHALSGRLAWIQIADLFGAYGVTFVVVLFGATGVDLVRNNRRLRVCLVTGSVVLFVLVYGVVQLRTTSPLEGPRIALVQANIAQELKVAGTQPEEILSRHIYWTRQALIEKPDLVVWPETMFPGFYGYSCVETIQTQEMVRSAGIPFLIGSNAASLRESDASYQVANSAFFLDAEGEVLGRCDKIHLVPFGEYVPGKGVFPRLEEIVLQTANFVPEISSGEEQVLFELKGIRFGVPICFEVVHPWISRSFVRRGADFLVNLTNEGWFRGSTEYEQLEQVAVFRAVENRVPVVRSGNSGITEIIESTGRIRIENRLEVDGQSVDVEGILVRSIRLDPRRSLYTLLGDVFVFLCGLVVLGALWRSYRSSFEKVG